MLYQLNYVLQVSIIFPWTFFPKYVQIVEISIAIVKTPNWLVTSCPFFPFHGRYIMLVIDKQWWCSQDWSNTFILKWTLVKIAYFPFNISCSMGKDQYSTSNFYANIDINFMLNDRWSENHWHPYWKEQISEIKWHSNI